MLMLAEPLARALEAAGKKGRIVRSEREVVSSECEKNIPSANHKPPITNYQPPTTPHSPRTIYLSPSGRPFTQALAKELSAEKELVLLCGRYEGIDQRIIDRYIDDEISVGDYVLSCGETAALIVIDATYRLLEQVITPASLDEESFSGGLLEYPQYTRPEKYDTLDGTAAVPEVLLSGHHEHIRRWRLEKRVEKTLAVRPDLIRRGEAEHLFDEETARIIEQKKRSIAGKRSDEGEGYERN
jgi:tRNA (guanine37-N1)-methyltransferase